MPDPVPIIIPTRSPPESLYKLVRQIESTAGYPHHILFTGEDASAAVNRNLGLRLVQGDIAVMVDDDVEFTPSCSGWLRVLVEALLRPDVLMVSAQLLTPLGGFAYMTGVDDCGINPKQVGETIVPTKRLLTACCAFKHCGLLFDENYVGSGFEDIDFCNQLARARPDGLFLVCHRAWAIHRNEQKNQCGENWRRNQDYYLGKWGKT